MAMFGCMRWRFSAASMATTLRSRWPPSVSPALCPPANCLRPEGLYFVNTGDWGNRSGVDTSLGVDIPVLAWSTPWTILGGRVQFLIAGPVVEVGVHRTTYLRGVYNPLVSGQLAWDLGNNWGFSYLLGAYLGVDSEVAWSSTSLNQRFALSYTGNLA